MLLRRFIQHVKDQNWVAVGLDFVIVVVGVLLAFQITSWNETRADRATELIYLSRLYEDMEQSVCRIEREQLGITRWNERARRTLDALLIDDPDAVDDTGFELIASTRVQTGSPFRATLNELVNGGRTNLISDEALRAHIAAADAELTSYGEYIQILVNAQATFLNQVHSRLRPTPGNVYEVTYDFETLADDDTFINSLGHALRITYANIQWLDEMREVANGLRIAVGEELGRDVGAEPDCTAAEVGDE